MLLDQAIGRLNQGDAAGARDLFAQAVAHDARDLSACLGLAYACAAAGDVEAASEAADAALALEPRDLRALLLKADVLQSLGDPLAVAFHRAALTVGEQHEGALPAGLANLLAKSRAALQEHEHRLSEDLRRHLSITSSTTGPWSSRFAESVDLLTGRRQLYLSQPRLYYFPGLAQWQFAPREVHRTALQHLEQGLNEIRNELGAVLAEHPRFDPYLRSDPRRPRLNATRLVDNPDWGAWYLWKDGEPVEANAARCPRTMQLLQGLPLVHVPRRSPNVLFSLLRPGAHIPPHNGFVNTRLIAHLPLIVPSGCRFRVGNETREWLEGQAWLFDDTVEHEAWNDGSEERVVLIFELWRPELTAQERDQVKALFAAVEAQRGGIENWGI